MAKDIKFNIIDDNFRILSLCLYFCGRVGILLAFQAAHSHPPATGCILQHSPCQLTVGIVLAFQAVHSHPPATGCLCNLSLCLYFCGRVGILLAFQAAHSHPPATGCILQHSPCQLTVGIVLAFQAVHSHPPATGYLTTLSQYAQQVVLFIFIPSTYKSKLLTLPDKNKAGLCPAYCFCCDPVGIRTQDPRLRR